MFQKYHVLSLLGSGSSSSVYLAEHLTLKSYRAIKCIPKTLARPSSVYLEAGLLKNLRHPGIPLIYDTEEDESYYYIIEEYIQGESLAALVQNQDNISQETVITFGIQLCEIIGYLHRQTPNPILYLDLKPEHIILCGKQLKLIDFGIATVSGSAGNQCQCCGTRGFAAPEQYSGEGLKVQTDIFGIGAVLYYMLTKKFLPLDFKASAVFPKYCSTNFKKIILKAAAAEIGQRYPNVEMLGEELQKVHLSRTVLHTDTHLFEKIIITGSQKRVGATHVAIGLVSWLNRQGKDALYESHSDNNPLPALLSYKDGFWQNAGSCVYGDFMAAAPGASVPRTGKPHIVVQDYGTRLDAVVEEEMPDTVILVVGSRPWELEPGIKAYEKLSGEEHVIIICNYNDKQMAQKYAGIFQKKVFCFPLDQEPFTLTKEKGRLFQQILRERREHPFG